MNTIHLVIGESGSGKSSILSELQQLKISCVDADKRKKDWDSLSVLVDEALQKNLPVVLTITRGITTYMKHRPDLKFRLYFIDLPEQTIIENRRKRALESGREINVDGIVKRIKRLHSIFRNYGVDGIKGDYNFILEQLKILSV